MSASSTNCRRDARANPGAGLAWAGGLTLRIPVNFPRSGVLGLMITDASRRAEAGSDFQNQEITIQLDQSKRRRPANSEESAA